MKSAAVALRAGATLLLLTLAWPAQSAPEGLGDALRAGELICEFRSGYRRATLADLRYGRTAPDLMLVYERLQPAARGEAGSAEVVSTQKPGRKPVQVRATGKAAYLMESVGPSVMVTTLTGCAGWQVKNGETRCVRYRAQHAWHFDTTALLDPDVAAERAPRGAYAGVCEPWTVD